MGASVLPKWSIANVSRAATSGRFGSLEPACSGSGTRRPWVTRSGLSSRNSSDSDQQGPAAKGRAPRPSFDTSAGCTRRTRNAGRHAALRPTTAIRGRMLRSWCVHGGDVFERASRTQRRAPRQSRDAIARSRIDSTITRRTTHGIQRQPTAIPGGRSRRDRRRRYPHGERHEHRDDAQPRKRSVRSDDRSRLHAPQWQRPVDAAHDSRRTRARPAAAANDECNGHTAVVALRPWQIERRFRHCRRIDVERSSATPMTGLSVGWARSNVAEPGLRDSRGRRRSSAGNP